jgi:hypothetical protein
VKGCFAAVLTLIFAPSLARAQLFTLSSITGWWDYDATYIRQLNPATGATISIKGIELPSGTYGTYDTGMTVHPTTGEFFVMVESAPSPTSPICQHLLAKLDPATGDATIIGNTGMCFASLAFHSNGTLYGVTLSEGAVPPALFTLDTTNATPTFLISFGPVSVSSGAVVGGSGLAFNPNDGLLYRSGRVGVSDQIFQAINPNTLAVTDIPLSGLPTDEIVALTHSTGNTLLGADTGNRLISITTGGFRTVVGPMDHLARGLAFATPPRSTVSVDFDGDGKSDIGIYRNGAWSILRSSDGDITDAGWGGPSWIPVPADYDGDGIADIAVRNPSNGLWSIFRSSDGGNTLIGWSAAANDVPVPADYDGDGKADLAVYNTVTAGWSIIRSSDGGLTYIPWGGPGWEPVPADYDGDGKVDIAVRRPNGLWSIVRSTDGGNTLIGWSADPNDIPVPADYDGDGKADLAVYNTATAGWSIIRSSDSGLTYRAWGGPAWAPVAADYDGDGKVDIAVYNESNGLWSILRSSDGGNTLVLLGGAPQDIPLN